MLSTKQLIVTSFTSITGEIVSNTTVCDIVSTHPLVVEAIK